MLKRHEIEYNLRASQDKNQVQQISLQIRIA